MPHRTVREVEHEITVLAPATAIYRLIAEVENWPQIFPPTVHVEIVEQTEAAERIRIWATANGEAKSWTSHRRLDPGGLRIDFRQEIPTPPVAAMGGAWVIEPLSGEESRVRLLHHYEAVGDDASNLEWIDSAVDRNSTSELAALKSNVESAHRSTDGPNGLLLSFEDTVQIDGEAQDVYDFLNEARLWPDRLPHVAGSTLTEETPGLQFLRMDTRTKDGHTHTTESVRVCFPHERIVYKQTTLPALMRLHTGNWTLRKNAGGVSATSQHTVIVNTETIAGILGEGSGVAQARKHIQDALSHNSRTTLRHAKQFAEKHR
ncbi:aromatase/cyclase [Streptomyces sp. RKAG290]|uniref:aromatase/cyclase n=1 Tax=Streptomyces sp. RKAG290 TaxID=2888348 RepID=UPI00203435E6|nr:aromatase/cyclase [Streptomyces sp. RKAG290]MCM2414270.1 aromatase/cyclase [Streptomyces sp. RKAG290]